MRILYLATRECWPLTTGARLRDYHLARQLASRCSLAFVALHDPKGTESEKPPEDAGFAEHLILPRGRSYTPQKLLRGLTGPTPVTVLNYYSPKAGAALAGILERGNYDAVQIEGVHLMGYLPVLQAAQSRPAILADWHNVESDLMWRYAAGEPGLARRLAARRTAQLIERAEDRLLADCQVHTVTSESDRRKLVARNQSVRIDVVPNGVDTAHYSDPEMIGAREKAAGGGIPEGSILFVGSMDYHANIDAAVWFVRQIWGQIHDRHPGLSLLIVGRNPSPEVRALSTESVIVTGTVEDVRPYYARALAAVVPLRVAGGTRLKIPEAMAAGVPVVSTRIGAEGLEVEDGESILLADTPGEVASAIEALVLSTEVRNRLARAGRALVAERYDWPALGEQLFRIHCEAVAEG